MEQHSQVPNSQEEALRELSISEAEFLHRHVDGPWQDIIEQEQEERQDMAKTFWEQPAIPTAEENTYTSAAAFFRNVREHNRHDPLTEAEIQGFATQSRALYVQSQRLEQGIPDDIREIFGGQSGTAQFIYSNLEQLLIGPLVHGLRTYDKARSGILAQTLPGQNHEIDGTNVFTIDAKRTTGKHLAEAAAKITDLDFTIQPFDFFQLKDGQKEAVLAAFMDEVTLLATMVKQAKLEDRFLQRKENERGYTPLAYLSTDDLRDATKQYPGAGVVTLFSGFFQHPQSFLEDARIFEQVQRQYEANIVALQKEAARKLPDMNPNQKRIRELVNDEEVRSEAYNLQIGDRIALSKADFPIRGKDLTRILDKHLILVGRRLYDTTDLADQPVDIFEWNTPKNDPSQRLQAKATGSIYNVQLARMPVTTEDLQEAFGARYDPAKHREDRSIKLYISADIKKTRVKDLFPIGLTAIIFTQEMPGNKANRIIRRCNTIVEGEDAIESEDWDSVARGWRVESQLRQRPFRGGGASGGRENKGNT